MELTIVNGDVIRGYDFKPIAGREDSFVEGEVIDSGDTTQGYQAYKIRCTRDVFGGESLSGEHSRVGRTVYIPWRVSFLEYQGRVMNLSR
jgi:hypothetical protein